MRRGFLTFLCISLIAFVALLSGCSRQSSIGHAGSLEGGSSSAETASQSEETSIPEDSPENSWEHFVAEMERQEVDAEDLLTLENAGISREEMMQMSATEIAEKIENLQSVLQQNKIDLLAQILEDRAEAKADERFVYSDSNGTERLYLVEQCIKDIQANEGTGFIGCMSGGTVPLAYEVAYKPEGQVMLMTYDDVSGLKEYLVAGIYDHPLFYHFTDHMDLHFSIPKTGYTFAQKIPVEGYRAGEDLESDDSLDPLTAQQAIDRAAETRESMKVYQESMQRQNINIFGEVIPETVTVDVPVTPAKVVGAVAINDDRYYKIAFFENQNDLDREDAIPVDVYYVSADGDIVFLESMVAGELIPIGYKGVSNILD